MNRDHRALDAVEFHQIPNTGFHDPKNTPKNGAEKAKMNDNSFFADLELFQRVY